MARLLCVMCRIPVKVAAHSKNTEALEDNPRCSLLGAKDFDRLAVEPCYKQEINDNRYVYVKTLQRNEDRNI
jgi:hypothetical protein